MTGTDVTRWFARIAFAALIGAGAVGWMLFDRDPVKLQGLLNSVVLALGAGEAANIGKRATFKREACEALGGKQ